MIKITFFVLTLGLILQGCTTENQDIKQLTKKELDQLMIDSQRAYIKKEDKMMDNYTQRQNWNNTIISSTGIRYTIYHQGVGESFNEIKKKPETNLFKLQ